MVLVFPTVLVDLIQRPVEDIVLFVFFVELLLHQTEVHSLLLAAFGRASIRAHRLLDSDVAKDAASVAGLVSCHF